ncbi:PREDICTED: C-C motif chemokine 25 isoform X1 [Hipposideros armiger]|uniref:C-C motif chemokine 25 n=1 Tax=Hipposideros armiger TaxID=186990 RepID=A0A8B7TC16_HIPAR|nr:PREDICTED: C-C motif chemokine 25 isoform X1 [Hipposideros armiger]XP_019523231.1 PREDICTED: C-C motif chemokine 25 isoform X1 [Hipposideros armiger]XP_019523232.1 PREDICTED: C-C motif chemokine 25 isoform X1 [Hipposideros armiger]XP_019523233.1 PREDICTED: C-C motif chemokine 25 isoform X1 [Hipposideros armiger]XP_019523235.1 PREDICTED: C-C motif chemokine 25 isoform X1 [Hipposideros armiger]XP_019523236.1 PREDICTED: C-C motif chemokine 25 isoform X1 [Hipposideros armiger]
MNLWLLAFLVSCFVDTWAPTVHAQGVFEDCCLAYHPHVRRTVLSHARSYRRQDVSGSCNLPAVIFYFPRRQKMVCGNPKDKWVQFGMRILDTRNEAHPKHPQGTRRTSQGSHSGGKKLSSGNFRLPLKLKDHTRSSQRNASRLTTANPGE